MKEFRTNFETSKDQPFQELVSKYELREDERYKLIVRMALVYRRAIPRDTTASADSHASVIYGKRQSPLE